MVQLDKPFHIAFLREITDQYDDGEISYGKLVEMLNDVAMKWHEQMLIEAMLKEHMFDDSEYANRRYKYWQQVKQEIEKL